MNIEWAWLLTSYPAEGDPAPYVAAAERLLKEGQLRLAASAYDRAFGLSPTDAAIQSARQALLDSLAVEEHGLTFRYIPAGTFLMGSENGDPDERPVHPVTLAEFWLSATPVSWDTYQTLHAVDFQEQLRRKPATIVQRKIRYVYCYDDRNAGQRTFTQKPMVAVSWTEIAAMCDKLSNDEIHYSVPTEAQWEKAARGGLIQQRYPWGNDGADSTNCDCERFYQFSILPSKQFAPNAYGLYGMCGGVWEWTADWYDADFYSGSEKVNPQGPAEGKARVWRGGSWADTSGAVTVSFRMAERPYAGRIPNLGFRLCRVERTGHMGTLR